MNGERQSSDVIDNVAPGNGIVRPATGSSIDRSGCRREGMSHGVHICAVLCGHGIAAAGREWRRAWFMGQDVRVCLAQERV